MDIKIFENPSMGSIRTAIDETGRAVFCLKDACDILDIKNVSDAKTRLKADGVTKIEADSKGGKQKLLFITEPNLYRLIMQSRKEEAVIFTDWIVEVVIPSIRQYGRYDVNMITSNRDVALELLSSYNEAIFKIKMLEKVNAETKEARDYVFRALDSRALHDLHDLPEILSIKGIGLSDILSALRNNGVFTPDNKPYQEYVDKGYFRVDKHTYNDKTGGEVINVRTFVYKKGINFIKKLLEDKMGG